MKCDFSNTSSIINVQNLLLPGDEFSTLSLNTKNNFSVNSKPEATWETRVARFFYGKLNMLARNLCAFPFMWYILRAIALNDSSYHLPCLVTEHKLNLLLYKGKQFLGSSTFILLAFVKFVMAFSPLLLLIFCLRYEIFFPLSSHNHPHIFRGVSAEKIFGIWTDSELIHEWIIYFIMDDFICVCSP